MQLDRICTRLLSQSNDASSGFSIRQQKHYRITVPQCFTGTDLCHWLLDRLRLDDRDEAVHLANMLMAHGYVFTVIDRDAPVRDDTNLYRLQMPYYWPSHSGAPDPIEYAIYLCKRLMRGNEQRHGLEEYEVDAYNRQYELWAHMWDYIQIQAEMQLKLHKERRKADKAVLDSQERAYWRLFRPPPVCSVMSVTYLSQNTATLDELYARTEPRMRKKTNKHYEMEIERMRAALKTKKYFAAGNSTGQHVLWCEQYMEYDPLLAGCAPGGNPWISDDQTYWLSNADKFVVENVKRIAVSTRRRSGE